jgi:hypothetical protein
MQNLQEGKIQQNSMHYVANCLTFCYGNFINKQNYTKNKTTHEHIVNDITMSSETFLLQNFMKYRMLITAEVPYCQQQNQFSCTDGD